MLTKPYLFRYETRIVFTADRAITQDQVATLLDSLFRIYMDGYQRQTVRVEYMEGHRYALQEDHPLDNPHGARK